MTAPNYLAMAISAASIAFLGWDGIRRDRRIAALESGLFGAQRDHGAALARHDAEIRELRDRAGAGACRCHFGRSR